MDDGYGGYYEGVKGGCRNVCGVKVWGCEIDGGVGFGILFLVGGGGGF